MDMSKLKVSEPTIATKQVGTQWAITGECKVTIPPDETIVYQADANQREQMNTISISSTILRSEFNSETVGREFMEEVRQFLERLGTAISEPGS